MIITDTTYHTILIPSSIRLEALLYAITSSSSPLSIFFFNDTATTEIYTLSLHDALPISARHAPHVGEGGWSGRGLARVEQRSEEHTAELQSRRELVCRLLLEKNKKCSLPPGTSVISQSHAHRLASKDRA